MKAVAAIITLLLVFPTSVYLQYQVFVRVDASDVMWILFWAQWPLLFVASAINVLADD